MSALMEATPVKQRRAIVGQQAAVLSEIYEEQANLTVWHRELPEELKSEVADFLASKARFKLAMSVSPGDVLKNMQEALGDEVPALCEDITYLATMYCDLFALKRVGLRLTVLSRAMCPKFHVDRVPCRLITTYQGPATEWLRNDAVDRSRLLMINKEDLLNQSGLYNGLTDINQINCGDVALLKGERWEGNEDAGLIHRSPAVKNGEHRLLLTFDFAD